MKSLISVILFFAGSCLFGQYSQQPTMQQSMPSKSRSQNAGPSLRLHGYATYAFDDNHVNSYYSETSYFDGAISSKE